MAYKVFSNGNTLNASELNTYLMNQSVMTFANAAGRNAALSAPIEGMIAWLDDTNVFTYYNGTTWQNLVGAGAWRDVSANTAISLSDASGTIRSTGSAITITIDNVLTNPGQQIDFIQAGTGQITFAAGSGVTLLSADSRVKTAKQYAAATVLFAGSATYYLIGNLGL